MNNLRVINYIKSPEVTRITSRYFRAKSILAKHLTESTYVVHFSRTMKTLNSHLHGTATDDTAFFDSALKQYREETGETRGVAELPVMDLSIVLRIAQELKDRAKRTSNGGTMQ